MVQAVVPDELRFIELIKKISEMMYLIAVTVLCKALCSGNSQLEDVNLRAKLISYLINYIYIKKRLYPYKAYGYERNVGIFLF